MSTRLQSRDQGFDASEEELRFGGVSILPDFPPSETMASVQDNLRRDERYT